jgi:hypothetical protein
MRDPSHFECNINEPFANVGGILPAAELFAGNAPAGVTVMRINIWIILGMLLALFAITRYTHYQKDTERICANDPTASV